jgi:hypothetical protein
MSLKSYLREKGPDRFKQFGPKVALKQIMSAVVRRVYEKNEDLILAVIGHKPEQFDKPEIMPLTTSMINDAEEKWGLSKEKTKSLRSLLTKDCIAFIAERGGQLAAHAFVQVSGVYPFARGGGRFRIPQNTAVLKNLLVLSQFRGTSIGKDLNLKRLSAIPEGVTPLAFVIPDNRYAIRNLKMFGFTEILKVKRITWLSRFTRQTTTIIKDIPITHSVISAMSAISGKS